jgi:ClpA/ClpB-like protein
MAVVGAWSEARRLGHGWVGEEHVLLALARGDGPAGDVLRQAGATTERVEETILAGWSARIRRSNPGAARPRR